MLLTPQAAISAALRACTYASDSCCLAPFTSRRRPSRARHAAIERSWLIAELFLDINDARRKIEAWRRDYNGNRPHTALCDMTPDEFAAKHRPSREAILNLG